jgi:Protein of unknown function (DUF4236)
LGFYIRKGFNFGPLRLNLSRSGLGASIGVKGARIGMGPRGTYVHLGRGGLYYRQTLAPPRQQPFQTPPLTVTDELPEISSAAAENLVDSSADHLLHELNRIKRRFDLFPLSIIVGIGLLSYLAVTESQWWVWTAALLSSVTIAICARHHDVTNGTLILNYSMDEGAQQKFSHVEDAFKRLAACQRIWHVDAGAQTSDWKRNAGGGFIERRSGASVFFGAPPKVESNINLPSIRAKRRSVYFLPDRVLIYDSSGVGAVPYEMLNVQAGKMRFIENESVPRDSAQVGSTWRYVNRDGGPDRRFNNNQQLPVMLYGELKFGSASGLNEYFQCSVPEAAAELSVAVVPLATKSESERIDISFASTSQRQGFARIGLWLAILLMIGTALVPPALNSVANSGQQASQLQELQAARQHMAQALNQDFLERKVKNATVQVADDKLELQIVNETPKAARRDGLKPLDKKPLFAKFLRSNAEPNLCALGFRGIRVTVNAVPTGEVGLACSSGR